MSMIAELIEPDVAALTVEAITEIGEAAASKLEANAEAIERRAKRVADNLRALALAMRDHCKIASAHVAVFGVLSNDVITATKEIDSLVAPKPKAIINGTDDGKPIPAFLQTTLPELAVQ